VVVDVGALLGVAVALGVSFTVAVGLNVGIVAEGLAVQAIRVRPNVKKTNIMIAVIFFIASYTPRALKGQFQRSAIITLNVLPLY